MSGRAFVSVAAVAMLASCDLFAALPPVEPDPQLPAGPGTEVPEPSAASRDLSAYYAQVQAELLSQGLMRRDGGGASAPFGARELAQDFVRIALYDEYTMIDGHLVARAQPSTLRRWETPIRMRVEFGASVSAEERRKDLHEIEAFAARLSALTGVPVTFGGGQPNFYVLELNEDERLAFGPRLQELEPGLGPLARRSIIEPDKSTFCLVHAFSSAGQTSAFTAAVAVIRTELPDLMQEACINEELAQGMGLANDSPSARPSIFNDDAEFALLTPHDEMLLRMLYDRRLRVGMHEDEALPIVREIAAEYFDGKI